MQIRSLLVVGVMLAACAREDGGVDGEGDATAGADSTHATQAPETTAGDTSALMSPVHKASADEPSPSADRKSTGVTPSKQKSGTPASDSTPPQPRPGMRPTARDRKPWQVPPPDDTTRTDSTRPPGNSPAP